jgi:hypothetical protein
MVVVCTRVRSLGLVAGFSLLVGCSFLGARVPDELPVESPGDACGSFLQAIDTTAAVISLVVLAVDLEDLSNRRPADTTNIEVSAPASAVFTSSATFGWIQRKRCNKFIHRASDHEWALAYAKYAQERASIGDCTTAQIAAENVARRDPTFYANEFMTWPGMASCLRVKL